ncbi:beta-galactosidase/beta-glucuronidase [Terriglobus roseus DSM 18391]|uniref:Beta-galactosidase/beta-glucuronidase n=1 Tax=Terriglobus roseus (strain DSM 18391 / NRRL B-41598 / KBS 63) TaxID=926566 RepID=I3ZBW6_TERRK|nr:glycoside hydrolase family 2 TIM barrel-domain containing protein [Terriglobus roseus]AFL86734.1 beta-galactosidase/beta-glucuronidase [Terriglobus roseus DSM 18391]
MTRRTHLLLLCLSTLLSANQTMTAQTARAPRTAASPRVEMSLRDGWHFKLGNGKASELATEPDSTWATVSVPHTWNRVGYYKDNPSSHINTATNVVTTQGVGWYKLVFTPPAAMAGKQSFLQFDAASRIATVWLNGTQLGTHRGSFSRFRLDSTAALKPGQPNTLTVAVDNSKPAPGSSTADVLPLTGDFFVYGGLYRPVTLVATGKVHLDLMDYGSTGVYAKTTNISPSEAQVQVRTRVRNDSGQSSNLVIRTRLMDAQGKIAGQQKQSVTVGASSAMDSTANVSVPRPHLWQGVSDPYLYRLVVEVLDEHAKQLDSQSLPFGIRQVRFDANLGLFLNGKHVAVHGVGYHQDREGKGWASEAADVAADEATMREMGVTGIRLTHYQHGQPIHDLADRDGLVVWDEMPLVSQWTMGENLQPTDALRENARQQLRELIAQDFNHPSVVTWSIANEVDFGRSIPGFVGSAKAGTPDPVPLLRELNQLAHELDPSRPTTLATCCEARDYGPNAAIPITGAVTDLSGANRYYGWYYDKPADLDAHLDTLHRTRPEQPMAVTEYGAGGAISLHSDNALGGPESRNRPQAEEYESYIHEQNWSVLRSKPYLWGTFLWNSFDFGSTTRSEGNAQDINTKGIVTFDHKYRKDPYFFYKANWATTPTVHINSSAYTERAYRVADVRVYSNAPKTSLTLNGKLIGVVENCPDRICVWKGVTLSPGANTVVAKGDFATGPVADTARWHLSDAASTDTNIDCGALVAGAGDGKIFGSDAFFEGGTAQVIAGPAERGRAPVPPAIKGTSTLDLAATYRAGTFSYRVPVADGGHRVTLTFVEPSLAAGKRVFSVLANGQKVVANLDVAAASGGTLTAFQRSFNVYVTSGTLTLDFKPTQGEAIVSAIEVH